MTSSDTDIEITVIGAGVVGCAIAQALSADGYSVMVLEREPHVGEGVTGRNSGVVHSGLYYAPGSLKARTCIEGNRLLYAWCERNKVPHRRTGKLVLASTPDEVDSLTRLFENADNSGAPGVQWVSTNEISAIEPEASGVAALYCPETGIVDPVELARSLLASAEEMGSKVVFQTTLVGITRVGNEYLLETSRGPIRSEYVINAAGLYADDVAALAGIHSYKIFPVRGDYFHLHTSRPYTKLIYPAPVPKQRGLGVHLTMDLSGAFRLGPDAEYVLSKEDYAPRENKHPIFLEAARRLLGRIEPEQISYNTCGIRPKLRSPADTEEKDFVIREDLPGFINLVGIDSPGLTASLSLAQRVRGLLG